jgi:hypothetical protein
MSKITLFHASPEADICSFHRGSHFGTRNAALERAGAAKFNEQEMSLYEVQINISRPLEIFDEGGPHTLEYIVGAIRSADRKTLNIVASDHILRLNDTAGERAAFDCLYKFLADNGRYDGLKYRNTTEGREEFSWVIFDPSQAQILAREPMLSDTMSFGC